MYEKPTAPLSIGGVLDDGFKLLRASFMAVLLFAILGSVFNQLPSLPIDETTAPASVVIGFALIALLLFLIGWPWANGALIERMDAIASQRESSLGQASRVGVRRLLPMLGCYILYILAVMGGSILLLIPGIILGVSLILGPYLVIVENLGPVEALRRSHKLVWGDWWRTAIIFTVIVFVLLSLYVLIGLAGVFAGYNAAASGEEVLPLSTIVAAIAVTIIVSAFVIPVLSAFSLSILNDLKLRKEGSDLSERLDALNES
ncbi:MAG: hypothetical protein AAF699_12955 [Pseudomonadota bacterium]